METDRMTTLRGVCPFCRLRVVSDDVALTIMHEAPVCPAFDGLANSGAEKPRIRTVAEEDVDAELAANASLRPCDTKDCAELATITVFWPGQTVDLCFACAQRAQKIAQQLGFELMVKPAIRRIA
jgi:hypothetical protein